MKRSPIARKTGLKRSGRIKPSLSARSVQKAAENKIPALSRHVVTQRDHGFCFRCGEPGTDCHHRRGRAVKDDHTHCSCNLVTLCRSCHSKTHSQPAESRENGWIVSRYEGTPGTVPALRWDGFLLTLWCDGDKSPYGVE